MRTCHQYFSNRFVFIDNHPWFRYFLLLLLLLFQLLSVENDGILKHHVGTPTAHLPFLRLGVHIKISIVGQKHLVNHSPDVAISGVDTIIHGSHASKGPSPVYADVAPLGKNVSEQPGFLQIPLGCLGRRRAIACDVQRFEGSRLETKASVEHPGFQFGSKGGFSDGNLPKVFIVVLGCCCRC